MLPPALITSSVAYALAEDLGLAGDITSAACIPKGRSARLVIAARQAGIMAGIALARETFHQMDATLDVTAHQSDGDRIAAGGGVLTVSGNAHAILAGERTALNFMGRMCGIATLTSAYVEAIRGTSAQITCTRKTTPGLRAFEKYAVACGGGHNHRFGLYDAVLIKDNHIAVAGGILPALKAAKAQIGHLVKIEIEVDTISQLEEVLAEGADVVLLDNMPIPMLQDAIKQVRASRPSMIVEASGGVNLSTVRAIAQTGVDLISVGALTHSAPVFDLGLDFMMID